MDISAIICDIFTKSYPLLSKFLLNISYGCSLSEGIPFPSSVSYTTAFSTDASPGGPGGPGGPGSPCIPCSPCRPCTPCWLPLSITSVSSYK